MNTHLKNVEFPLGLATSGDAISLKGTSYVYGSGPQVLITAALHGDEPTSIAALWYLAEYLTTANLRGTVTIIPCANIIAARESTRLIPREEVDLNRVFPGRSDGNLAERIANALAQMMAEYDVLIDVHTAGWCVPFILLDHITELEMRNKITAWAQSAELPVIGEMPAAAAALQGLDKCWTAWAISQGKTACTLELSGYRTIESKAAQRGAQALQKLLNAISALSGSREPAPKLPFRVETFANTNGLFEALLMPGERVPAGQGIGVVRDYDGRILENVKAAESGLVLALQPVSAVHVGSWLVTIATLD